MALALLVISAAAIVKGAMGFGFPQIAVPLVANILDARSSVVILSVASLFANTGLMFRGGGSRATFWRLAPILGGLIVGTIGGALLLANVDAVSLGVFVGTCALVFAAIALLKPDLAVPPGWERYLALPTGLLGGLLGGSTSIFAPAIASYLHALHLKKREFVFFVTLLFMVGGMVQVASYAKLGLYNTRLLLIILASLVPTAAGVWLGVRLQDRIDPGVFRRLVLAVICFSGINLVARGLWR
ncbi:MAG TPA: sulfite exporter TauE/SafE family protein [Chloroflexota bacterium]|nr:sulfite exporter TauE/SafE family protein [Chloroflexota bacterium]